MFTGLIQAKGEVVSAHDGEFVIASPWAAASIAIGASIACDGCCLTVTALLALGDEASHFSVQVSEETLRKTTLGDWRKGRAINLERSLKAGDEMGGHIVSGHVDGVAEILSIEAEGFSKVVSFKAPKALAPFIAPKGSVTLNGTSLTVNEVKDDIFIINFVPHTLDVTTWGERLPRDRVNLEIDVVARYVARLLETKVIQS